jgi:hypothetical protein
MIAEVDAGTARMLSIAAAREPVYVLGDNGVEVEATLIHWRNRRARVQFASGRLRTVDTAYVRPLPKAARP